MSERLFFSRLLGVPAWTMRPPAMPAPGQVDLTRLDAMVGLLDRLIDRLLARGQVQVVLMESPVHPRITQAYGDKLPVYFAAMERIAMRSDVAYWRLSAEAQLRGEDFHDGGHVADQGARSRFQVAFIRHVADLLQKVRDEPK